MWFRRRGRVTTYERRRPRVVGRRTSFPRVVFRVGVTYKVVREKRNRPDVHVTLTVFRSRDLSFFLTSVRRSRPVDVYISDAFGRWLGTARERSATRASSRRISAARVAFIRHVDRRDGLSRRLPTETAVLALRAARFNALENRPPIVASVYPGPTTLVCARVRVTSSCRVCGVYVVRVRVTAGPRGAYRLARHDVAADEYTYRRDETRFRATARTSLIT